MKKKSQRGGLDTFQQGYSAIMETYLKSNLTPGLSYKNEVKSIVAVQNGGNYGFILEIESAFGTYYCPVVGYRTKDVAIQELRKQLKQRY